jgi:Tol biopolymer transport system component
MNDDGSGLVQLTDNDVDDVNPFWSPDGRYLAFTHQDPDNSDIFITSAERPLLLPLTDEPAGDFGASWAPTKPAQ